MSTSIDNRTSRSLVYGLNLLQLFTVEQPVRGIAELAEAMNVSRPTAHRYASTCLELGYLEQAPMRRYRLTRRSAEPGVAMLHSLTIAHRARPILRELREQTGRTVSHAILDGVNVLYLQRLCGFERGQYSLEKGLGAGLRRPASRTAAGQALLIAASGSEERELRRIGPGGLAVDHGGLHEEALGLAIAVEAEEHATSSIEITVPGDAMSPSRLSAELTQPLLRAGAALQTALAGDGTDLHLAGLAH